MCAEQRDEMALQPFALDRLQPRQLRDLAPDIGAVRDALGQQDVQRRLQILRPRQKVGFAQQLGLSEAVQRLAQERDGHLGMVGRQIRQPQQSERGLQLLSAEAMQLRQPEDASRRGGQSPLSVLEQGDGLAVMSGGQQSLNLLFPAVRLQQPSVLVPDLRQLCRHACQRQQLRLPRADGQPLLGRERETTRRQAILQPSNQLQRLAVMRLPREHRQQSQQRRPILRHLCHHLGHGRTELEQHLIQHPMAGAIQRQTRPDAPDRLRPRTLQNLRGHLVGRRRLDEALERGGRRVLDRRQERRLAGCGPVVELAAPFPRQTHDFHAGGEVVEARQEDGGDAIQGGASGGLGDVLAGLVQQVRLVGGLLLGQQDAGQRGVAEQPMLVEDASAGLLDEGAATFVVVPSGTMRGRLQAQLRVQVGA